MLNLHPFHEGSRIPFLIELFKCYYFLMEIISGRWPVYTWKNELKYHSEHAVQHFHEIICDEYSGTSNTFDMFERAFVLTGFIIRRMIEKKLVTDKTASKTLKFKTFVLMKLDSHEKPWVSDSGLKGFGKINFDTPEIKEMNLKTFGHEVVHCSQLSFLNKHESIEPSILVSSEHFAEKRFIQMTIDDYTDVVQLVLNDQIKTQADGYHPESGEVFAIRE